ncbi:MAG TPA: hypothetical protein VGQ83_40140 [Polyangia bacterium]|jgi:hypothetical protein
MPRRVAPPRVLAVASRCPASPPRAIFRACTVTRLGRFVSSGYRGDPLTVEGTVRVVGGGSASGRTVEVHVRPAGGGAGLRLGALTTDVAGRFTGTLNLPADLDLVDYRVVAVTLGDERRAGSASE